MISYILPFFLPRIPVGRWVAEAVSWIKTNLDALLGAASWLGTNLFDFLESVLLAPHPLPDLIFQMFFHMICSFPHHAPAITREACVPSQKNMHQTPTLSRKNR